MPEVRPFRALRFDRSVVGDPGLVVAPPYDVIGPDLRATLEARHPANVVRLDLPVEATGDEPEDRYRRAARTLAAWRSDGTLRKDPHPSVYVYEQTFVVPGTDVERTQRGFFARLRLEPFGPESGVLPHERTLAGPREDRYKLLRATGVNTSPVVALFDDDSGATAKRLAFAAAGPADLEVTDDDGVRHRLWAVPADGEGASAEIAAALIAGGRGGPRHHRRRAPSLRDGAAVPRRAADEPVLRGGSGVRLPPDAVPRSDRRAADGPADASDGDAASATAESPAARSRAGSCSRWSAVDSAAALVRRSSAPGSSREAAGAGSGSGPEQGGALLTARRDAFASLLPPGGEAVAGARRTLLGVALEQLARHRCGGRQATAPSRTRSRRPRPSTTVDSVEADAAFLLEGTPVASILAVAGAGDVMPQKSTYFYPKALSGLVINPHEW